MSSRSTEFKVPTLPLTVEWASLGDRDSSVVEIFLAAQQMSLQAQFLEMLESDQQFVAARTPNDPYWTLYNKAKMVWIAFALNHPPVLLNDAPLPVLDDDTSDIRRSVRIVFVSHSPIEGRVSYSAAPNRSRLTDFLNRDDAFITVQTDTQLYFVNKAHIQSVYEKV